MSTVEEDRNGSAAGGGGTSGLPAVSPLATGGAGTIFEYRVAAVVLAALLRHDTVHGLGGPVEVVELQRRALHPLDDVVVKGLAAPGVELVVEYQIKRNLHPVASDDTFRDVVHKCLMVLRNDPEGIADRRHRLGFIVGGQLTQLADLRELAEIARAHATAISFRAVLPNSRRSLSDRYEQLCGAIGAVMQGGGAAVAADSEVDELGWRLLRALEVWVFETGDGSRDVPHATDRLRDLLAPDAAPLAAEHLFRELASIAESWGPHAAQIDAPMLRAELERRGVALSSAPRERAALARLGERSAQYLEAIPKTLGRRHRLARDTLLQQVVEGIVSNAALLVCGTAGVGKTVLSARAVQRLGDLGASIAAFSLTGRRDQTLSTLEAELGVSLRSTLRAAPTTGLRVVFIDGAEQVLSDAGALLLAVLRAIPLDPQDAPPWQVVVTVRDEAAEAVSDFMARVLGQAPARIRVGDLTDEEVEEVIRVFPSLAAMDRGPRTLRLLRRPYLVDLLVRAGESVALPDAILAEEDILDLVLERLVRLHDGALPGRGAADARSDLYLAMADAVIANRRPARLTGLDADARQGLVSDDILRRITASFDFAHDILADYAVATRLLEADGETLVATCSSPRRLLRAIRLWVQHRIARAGGAAVASVWTHMAGIAARLGDADGARWLDVPYEALLHSGRLPEVLAALQPLLLRHEAAALSRLMDVTERLARPRRAADEVAREPALDIALAAPVVGILSRCANGIPATLWPAAARLTRRTLAEMARAGAEIAASIPEVGTLSAALRVWAGDPERRGPLNDALLGLALLGGHLDEAGLVFLRACAHRRPQSVAAVIENPRSARALAEHHPDCLLALAGAYYLDQDLTLDSATPLPSRRHPQAEPWRNVDLLRGAGVRDHSGRLRTLQNLAASALASLGPFAVLLGVSPRHGLRLVGAVVDAASAARCREEATRGTLPLALDLQIEGWSAARAYRGTADIWVWYRRLSVGPDCAISALMALREWALREVAAGRNLRAVLAAVLCCGESIAFVAVAYSLLVERVADAPVELDDFLAHPLIWHLETWRAARESSTLALPVAQGSPLKLAPSGLAIALVRRSDAERQADLKRVGERLIASTDRPPLLAGEAEEASTAAAERERLLRRRWAAELDIACYKAQRIDRELEQVTVSHPEEVTRGLAESGGRRAAQVIELSGLTVQAAELRDGKAAGDPLVVWQRLQALTAAMGAEPYQGSAVLRFADGRCACAAALLLRADVGGYPVSAAILRDAAQALLAAAEALPGEGLGQDLAGGRDMQWDLGADRSAATALPRLVRDASLRARCGVSCDALSLAIVALAGSVSAEVRTRLAAGLTPIWSDRCQADPFAHQTTLAALRKLIATAGLGARDQYGNRRRVRLAEPIEESLRALRLGLLPEDAADALPGLIAAAGSDCSHGRAAGQLLEALVDFDLRTWPTEIARQHYELDTWRAILDRLTAERALAGQPAQLRRYLQNFAPVAEDLRGLLTALAAAAVTPARAAALHDLWPEIFAALLPGVRTLQPLVIGERPYHRDVDELDEALLPLPPEGAEWPWQRTWELFLRWVAAFRGAADVGDRCLVFLARCGWLHMPDGIAAVLEILGDDAEAIRQECHLVVRWLRDILRMQPPCGGAYTPALQGLLDGLAAAGDEAALALQRELEA